MNGSTFWQNAAGREGELTRLWHESVVLARSLAITEDTGITPDLQSLELRRPLRIVLIGEKACGKTALLHQLASIALETNPLPTEKIIVHTHSHNTSKIEAGWCHETHDHESFRLVEWVDTSGLGFQDEPWHEDLRRTCDAFVLVFCPENPWAASTWKFLDLLGAEALDRCAIVLTKSDQRHPDELRLILGHMRDIVMQRLGVEFPIWCTSLVKERQAQLDWPALQRRMSGWLRSHPERVEKQRQARDRINQLLQHLDDILERRSRALREEGGFLDGLEQEIARLRQVELDQLESRIDEYLQGFEEAQSRALEDVAHRLNPWARWRAIIVGDTLPTRFDEALQSHLTEQTKRRFDLDQQATLSRLSKHWDSIRPRTRDQLKLNLGDFETAALHQVSELQIKKLPDILRQSLLKERLRESLVAELTASRESIHQWVVIALIFSILAGLAGTQEYPVFAYVLLVFATFAIVLSALKALIAKRRSLEHLNRRLNSYSERYKDALNPFLREWKLALLSKYRNAFTKVNHHIASIRQDLLPAQTRWRALYLQFRSFEQDL